MLIGILFCLFYTQVTRRIFVPPRSEVITSVKLSEDDVITVVMKVEGKKVLVPVEVKGISAERIAQLNPFTYHSMETLRRLLKAQIIKSRYYLKKQAPGLPEYIYNAMDFW